VNQHLDDRILPTTQEGSRIKYPKSKEEMMTLPPNDQRKSAWSSQLNIRRQKAEVENAYARVQQDFLREMKLIPFEESQDPREINLDENEKPSEEGQYQG
jgi:hypothetical protein